MNRGKVAENHFPELYMQREYRERVLRGELGIKFLSEWCYEKEVHSENGNSFYIDEIGKSGKIFIIIENDFNGEDLLKKPYQLIQNAKMFAEQENMSFENFILIIDCWFLDGNKYYEKHFREKIKEDNIYVINGHKYLNEENNINWRTIQKLIKFINEDAKKHGLRHSYKKEEKSCHNCFYLDKKYGCVTGAHLFPSLISTRGRPLDCGDFSWDHSSHRFFKKFNDVRVFHFSQIPRIFLFIEKYKKKIESINSIEIFLKREWEFIESRLKNKSEREIEEWNNFLHGEN